MLFEYPCQLCKENQKFHQQPCGQKDEPFSHELTLNLEKLLWFFGLFKHSGKLMNTPGNDLGLRYYCKWSCSTGTREVLFDCTCSFSSCLPELLVFTCSRTPKLRLLFPGHLDARVHGFKRLLFKALARGKQLPSEAVWPIMKVHQLWISHVEIPWNVEWINHTSQILVEPVKCAWILGLLTLDIVSGFDMQQVSSTMVSLCSLALLFNLIVSPSVLQSGNEHLATDWQETRLLCSLLASRDSSS